MKNFGLNLTEGDFKSKGILFPEFQHRVSRLRTATLHFGVQARKDRKERQFRSRFFSPHW
jgi:hypothetical protein